MSEMDRLRAEQEKEAEWARAEMQAGRIWVSNPGLPAGPIVGGYQGFGNTLASARDMLRVHEETIADPDVPESLKGYYREQRDYWRDRIAELDARTAKG